MEKVGSHVAFIPLRAGSKSIPEKNHKLLAGKALFRHVLDACLESGVFEKVVVATDSEDIKTITRKTYKDNASVMIYDRSAENAQDHSSTESVMLEFTDQYDYEYITLVQATSPLTAGEDFRTAWQKFEKQAFDSLLTVVREKRFYWKEGEDGSGYATNYEPLHRPRRQDFDGNLVENGAFYITSREALIETQCRLSGKIGLHIMSADTTVEIDEPEDFEIVEKLINRKRKESALDVLKSNIKLVLSDVDGVLTDAGMYYSENGDETKKFNTRDGKGFELLKNAGIKVGIVTGEDTKIVARRAKKLKIDFLFQGVTDKVEIVSQLIEKLGLTYSQVAYIGDDVNDLELLKLVGMSFCPSNAVEENKMVVDIICSSKGGEGCFRELAEYLLKRVEKEA